MLNQFTRLLYFIGGIIAFALGMVGIVVPLLPTTPFVLVAVFCFSRGSPRLHQWLLSHRLFGPVIQNWENYGVIRPRVKWIATVSIIIMLLYPIGFLVIPFSGKILAALVGAGVIIFIQGRPSQK